LIKWGLQGRDKESADKGVEEVVTAKDARIWFNLSKAKIQLVHDGVFKQPN
jgi:hypothetical protein